jgi:hypothetical protein
MLAPLPLLQWNSASESRCTLDFGKRVTEVTLGAAKKNTESAAAYEAKELVRVGIYRRTSCSVAFWQFASWQPALGCSRSILSNQEELV